MNLKNHTGQDRGNLPAGYVFSIFDEKEHAYFEIVANRQ